MGLGILWVAAVAFGAEGAAPAAAPSPVERLLPADAVVVVQVNELAKLGQAFEQSALGEAIQGSPLLRYLKTAAGAAAEFGAVLVSGQPAEQLRACAGQHMGLALLDFKDAADLKARVPIVVLIEAADPKKLEGMLEAQVQLLSLLSKELAVTRKPRGGTTVVELSSPNGVLAYAVREGFLAVGTREGVAALLEAGEKPRLAADPTYQAVKQNLPTPTGGLSLYVNVRALLEKLGVAGNPEGLQGLRALGLASVAAAGLAVDFDGRQARERLYIHTGGQPTGLLRLLTEGQPVAPARSPFLPPSYGIVATLATRDVGLWDRVRAALIDIHGDAAADFVDTRATQMEQNIGIHPKKAISDAFGDELFIALDLSRLGDFFGAGHPPTPQELPVLLGAKLRDAATLRATLDRIAANQHLWELQVERRAAQHAGTDLYTFHIPMNPDLRPSYAIVDNTLLLSTRPEPVAAALDARKAHKEAVDAPAVGRAYLHAGDAGDGRQIPRASMHALLEANEGQILGLLLGCIRKELPEESQRFLPELDRVLAGLHGYEASLRREAGGVSVVARSGLGTPATFLLLGILIDQSHPVVGRRVEGDFDQIGAALEACRAKKGEYPEKLEALVPDFLPSLGGDRFAPARPYGYSRGKTGPDGKLPDAWVLTSVGPDKLPDIPVEQFDPPAWSAMLKTEDPDQVQQLKRVICRFQPERYPDERKNNDEGDLYRMGGKGIGVQPPPAPKPPDKPRTGEPVPKKEEF
jgi:hypothetical protein